MASLRELKRRIISINKTKAITQAMKLVAGAKFKKLQDSFVKIKPYATKLNSILEEVSARTIVSHKYFKRYDTKNIGYIIISGDRGLCGAFNNNIIRFAVREINDKTNSGYNVKMLVIGTKAVNFFKKKKYELYSTEVNLVDHLSFEKAKIFCEKVIKFYEEEELSELNIIYNQFKSALQQNVIIERFLPITKSEDDTKLKSSDNEILGDYIYEPSAEELLETLIERQLTYRIYTMLLESSTAEQCARMNAMEAATDNAVEFIDTLTLQYNKARQAAITTELTEIVGGAEALK